MKDEIKVSVFKYPDRKNLVLGYDDPTTGKRATKSAKTADGTQAERAAAVWQDELTSGRFQSASKLTWGEFTNRYKAEKVSGLAKGSQIGIGTTFNLIGRVLDPDRLAKMTAAAVSLFQSKLRKEGMKETTIAFHLRNVRAALRWSVAMGMTSKAPSIQFPKIAKGSLMKGRPITGEEFDRMITTVPTERPHDAELWRQFLTGLWLSGLRLDEACILSWDEEEPFTVDLTGGRRPAFRILAAAQKSRRDELLPMTPDFAEFILTTFPESERVGKVFKLTTTRGAKSFVPAQVGKAVSRIGQLAGVVVNKAEGKYASAHDLRRAFGTRWAKRVSSAVLKKLMRHSSIATTEKYYVQLDADEVADDLWTKFGTAEGNTAAQCNILGNSCQNKAF